jgi:ABC-type uncharacterized transport system auxiliary subunit
MMKKRLIMFVIVFLLSGCMGGAQTFRTIERYTLEYPVPRFENISRIGPAMRVERFSAVREFCSNTMVYRAKPYVRDIYNYQRWNIKPADLVTEFVLRDMRSAGVSGSVLSYEDGGDARFVLEGRVEEFIEIDEGEKSWASLVVYVKVSDSSGKTGDKRIILEKSYKILEPFKKDRQPDELARAMSAAMEKLSKELIPDIYKAAKGSV